MFNNKTYHFPILEDAEKREALNVEAIDCSTIGGIYVSKEVVVTRSRNFSIFLLRSSCLSVSTLTNLNSVSSSAKD